MKSIAELAREAGFHDFYCGGQDYHNQIIQRFHDLTIAQYREGLLAGVGVPFCHLWVDPQTRDYIVDRCDHPPAECIDAFTADQLAAAVLRERERFAQICTAIALKPSNVILGVVVDCAAAIRGQQ